MYLYLVNRYYVLVVIALQTPCSSLIIAFYPADCTLTVSVQSPGYRACAASKDRGGLERRAPRSSESVLDHDERVQ